MMQLGQRNHIVLDSAGLFSPVVLEGLESKDKTKSREETDNFFQKKKMTEELLIALTLHLSHYIIIVLEGLTWQEQQLILRITRSFVKLRGITKHVFVIHNMKNVKTVTELESLFEKRCQFYDGSEKKPFEVTNGTVNYYLSEKNHARHLCLGNDASLKSYNAMAIEMLKTWIKSVEDHESINRNAMEYMCDTLKDMAMSAFSGTVDKVKFENEHLQLCGTNLKPTKISGSFIGFQSSYQPSYYIEQTQDLYRIGIAMPGVKDTDSSLKFSEIDGQEMNCWGFVLSATIGAPYEEKNLKENSWDSGNFTKAFNIPNMFKPETTKIQNLGEGWWRIEFRKVKVPFEIERNLQQQK